MWIEFSLFILFLCLYFLIYVYAFDYVCMCSWQSLSAIKVQLVLELSQTLAQLLRECQS